MRLKAMGVALILALFWVPIAGAKLSPGVHADPHSPTSTEYAVPLNNARGDSGSSSASLFGQGITSASHTASATTTTTTTAAKAKQKHQAKRKASKPKAAASGAGNTPTTPTASTAPSAGKVLHPGSGSGVAWMVGVAVIVLLLGGGGAAVLAIRGRPQRGASELG